MTSSLLSPPEATADSLPPTHVSAVPRAPGGAKWLLGVLAGAACLGALFFVGYLPKQRARAALIEQSRALASEAPAVNVTTPSKAKAGRSLTLTGNALGAEQTVIFARANGYVRRWHADLGQSVAEGELLAELDTPELDREIEQARAALLEADAAIDEAKATHEFSGFNLQRFQTLVPAGVASQRELEQAKAALGVDQARVRVAQAARASRLANLHRLEQLKSFARVQAPFAGAITARRIDRGSLVNAGASALYELAVLDPLRVVLAVPQSQLGAVRVGQKVSLGLREAPKARFEGTVTRSAGTLDPASRTMTFELAVPNPDRRLTPGMYLEATLDAPGAPGLAVLPASSLVGGKEGVRVATVDADSRVRFKPVTVARDTGVEVEIASGLDPSDRIVTNPSPSLTEGARVAVLPQRP